MTSHSNRLKNSTSPYLLQHAHNPVDWYPWGPEAFEKAKKEDKPIILSIGYSSCHWCHVMERESFENEHVAEVMNQYFVSIKVDREERPDVDQIYMDAIQAMGMNGGWPLNVFLTPELKPFYGGTYFPPQQWHQLLTRIATIYTERYEEVEESANQLTEALQASEIHKYQLSQSNQDFSDVILNKAYQKLSSRFDKHYGGVDKAPKFPMPSIWLFLLRYAVITNHKEALDHLKLTLDKIAAGGIYDQAGGGFTRYSTDKEWKVPHFEKMLYDNGQLLSLYSEAYNATKDPYYKKTIEKTVSWLEREMLDSTGGFYSALDADSEDEEGKFYVFTIEEIESELPEELTPLVKDYYNISTEGNWEHMKNILHAEMPPVEYARAKNMDAGEVERQIDQANKILLEYRSARVRPSLDNKILTSWNALTITGLADAWKATGDKHYKTLAEGTMGFLLKHMVKEDHLLRSYNNGEAGIEAYLEDYAHFIQALVKMYEITFYEEYLRLAEKWTNKVINEFYDPAEQMFFYTSGKAKDLIARKKEIFDNVIPSSNSTMGINLFLLSKYFDKKEYYQMAEQMLRRVCDLLPGEPAYLSNWALLYQFFSCPVPEIVITGENYQQMSLQLEQSYLPLKIIMGSEKSGSLPLMENRKATDDKTTIYICYNNTCQLPVHSVDEALKQLH